MQYFDTYNLRARLFPAVIAISPAIAFTAIAISWDAISLPQVMSTAAIGVLFFAAADFARRMGKRFEREMFAATGGKPVMTLLRHSDQTLDKKTKERYRTYLAAQLGEKAPTAQAEARDSNGTDGFYGRCGAWLRERTRDKAKFKILFEENMTYGFRRNLYGLRVAGLVLNLLVVFVCLYLLSPYGVWINEPTRAEIFAVLAIAVLHAGYFLFFVSRRSVEEASDQYARQLILSCEGMMRETEKKSSP